MERNTIRTDWSKIDIDRQSKYEARWVWYHTLLAIELGFNVLMLILIYNKL